jgi:DNA-binding beta-propeller fold protein YncE
VPDGSYRVKISLGLSGEFDRFIEWEPPSVLRRGIHGMATSPNGNIYFLQGTSWVASCGNPELVAFSSEGTYLRTLAPPPANDLQNRPGVKVTTNELTGELLPKSAYPNFVPGLSRVRRQIMLVRNGRLLMAMWKPAKRGSEEKGRRRILSLGLDGRLDGAPGGGYMGPALPGFTTRSPAIYLAATEKGDVIYVAGLKHDKKDKYHAVLRGRWTDSEFAPFLGTPHVEGNDATHLKDPRGMAIDREGRLLVCDFGNDRIQVVTPQAKVVKSLPVPGPEQVIVHPETGAVYVFSVRDKGRSQYGKGGPAWDDYHLKSVVKYDGVDTWKETASIELPKRKKHMHDPGPIMALESSGRTPMLWVSCVGRADPTDYLWRIEDRGRLLVRVACPIPRYRWPWGSGRGALIADWKRDEVYIGGRPVKDIIYRVDGKTGVKTPLVRIAREVIGDKKIPTDHRQISSMALDRDGLLYIRYMPTFSGMENWIRRYDRSGRIVPFGGRTTATPTWEEAGAEKKKEKKAEPMDEILLTQPSHGYHPGGFIVAANGDIYSVDLAEGEKHRTKTEHNVMNIFDRDGRLKAKGYIPWLTSAAWGPKMDFRGHLYFTEAVAPRDRKSADGKSLDNMMRGCLLQFRPAVAREVHTNVPEKDALFVLREHEKSFPAATLQGLNWHYYGVSPIPFGHCICAASQFDVDGFGRSIVPDTQNCCIKVIDPAGNLIVALGGYGNWDSKGPESSVPVPKIPIRSADGIAVSDKAIYVFDSANRRVVRIKLTEEAKLVLPIR